MTFVVTIQVNDGIVIGTDSASTLFSNNIPTAVYHNADKIFNLCRGLPLGVVTWGCANIGDQSVSTIIKDFRNTLSQDDLKSKGYTISEMATLLRGFILDRYRPFYIDLPEIHRPYIGFIVAGYSYIDSKFEQYQIDIYGDLTKIPDKTSPDIGWGVTWRGVIDPVSRLFNGFSDLVPGILIDNLGVDSDIVKDVMQILKTRASMSLVSDIMPIKDAIDLAEFLVDVTIKCTRFSGGLQLVGGPVELATITKHEGFKWIHRKHYYSQSLNAMS